MSAVSADVRPMNSPPLPDFQTRPPSLPPPPPPLPPFPPPLPALSGPRFSETPDVPIATAGAGHRSSAAGGAGPPRRVVRVVEFDRLSRQVQHVEAGVAKTTAQVDALQEELRLTRHVRHGLDALQTVARQNQFPCGRALQRVLAQRLLERLNSTPARPTSRGKSTSQQSSISFDVPFTRSGLDELVAMCGVSYSPRVGRRLARPMRIVHFSGVVDMLRALDLWTSVDRELLMCRRFTRLDKSKPARPLLERHLGEDGTTFFILDRERATEEVVVSVRESETYDVRRQAFKDPLQRKRVARSSLPGLSEFCPCFISWRESSSSSALEWEGADACGSVSLSVPCCTFEQLPADVAALVRSIVG